MNKFQIESIFVAIWALTVLGSGYWLYIEDAEATGGAGQIAEMIMTKLNDAQTYLNEGDIKSAQQEIDEAIKELKDTYEADK